MLTETYIENLVFKGGGIKGIAYTGALYEFTQAYSMLNVKRVAGTSAGAIVATLLSIGYTPLEMNRILFATDFSKFQDRKNIFRIFSKYGIYTGDRFIDWLSEKFERKNINPKITFKELQDLGFKDLYVFATNLNKQCVEGFSVDRTPNVSVVEAVRASMSIPMFFKAWKFSKHMHTDDIYVDGGMIYNYPISVFDNDMFLKEDETVNPRTLGFYLTNVKHERYPLCDFDQSTRTPAPFSWWQPFKYIKYLFSSMLDGQVVNFQRNPGDVKRTVIINDYGISATDFDLSDNDKSLLIESGRKSTFRYILKHGK